MSTEISEYIRRFCLTIACKEVVDKLEIFKRTLLLSHNTPVVKRLTRHSCLTTKAAAENMKGDNNKSNCNGVIPAKDLNQIRLVNEIDTIIRIYRKAYESLSTSNPEQLEQIIGAHFHQTNKEHELQVENRGLKLKLNSLKRDMKTQYADGQERLKHADEIITELRFKRKYIQQINVLEYDLVKKWEESRQDQAVIACDKLNQALQQQIREIKNKINNEQRFICEIEAFYRQQIDELKHQITEWKEKYARESMRQDTIIEEKKETIQKLLATFRRRVLENEYRKQEAEDYIRKKTEEQQRLEWQRLQIQSALRIQAWWRGLMVRRCLGPYKKKATKKPKKANNKSRN